MMFVAAACGAVSGFHAAQSRMMARRVKSEKEGRAAFYGAMAAEGVVALIRASPGVTFYVNHGSLPYGMRGLSNAGGAPAMIGVIARPVASGDTAFRSARLTIADWFGIDQANTKKRAVPAIPLPAAGALFIAAFDGHIPWRCFSWTDQTPAMIAPGTGAAFPRKFGFPPAVSLMRCSAAFMTPVSLACFFQAPERPRLGAFIAHPAGAASAPALFSWFCRYVFARGKNEEKLKDGRLA